MRVMHAKDNKSLQLATRAFIMLHFTEHFHRLLHLLLHLRIAHLRHHRFHIGRHTTTRATHAHASHHGLSLRHRVSRIFSIRKRHFHHLVRRFFELQKNEYVDGR